jgi:hypothetical protein
MSGDPLVLPCDEDEGGLIVHEADEVFSRMLVWPTDVDESVVGTGILDEKVRLKANQVVEIAGGRDIDANAGLIGHRLILPSVPLRTPDVRCRRRSSRTSGAQGVTPRRESRQTPTQAAGPSRQVLPVRQLV